MFLTEVMDCEMIPAIFTSDIAKDNVANMEMYMKLLEEGKEKHFCPILFRKEDEFIHYLLAYQDRINSKEDYIKLRNSLLDWTSHGCFDLWLARIFYNYDLNDYASEEYFWKKIRDIDSLPESDRYKEIVSNASEQIQSGIFDDEEVRLAERIEFGFDNYCFAKIPTENPWEILAWIPMGGFNWCPPAEYQIVVARELYQKYGAQLMYVGYDTLKFYVKKPIMKEEGLFRLLKTLRIASRDIYTSYESAAEDILGSNVWHMWWD